jgi:hypothetical protein
MSYRLLETDATTDRMEKKSLHYDEALFGAYIVRGARRI